MPISPGPWSNIDGGNYIDVFASDGTHIARVFVRGDVAAIAEVPTMLELLRENPGEDCPSAACGTCWYCRKDALLARLSPQDAAGAKQGPEAS